MTTFEWTRLAVPIPTMLPSLNQIGFDYMNWIVGVVAMGETHCGGGRGGEGVRRLRGRPLRGTRKVGDRGFTLLRRFAPRPP